MIKKLPIILLCLTLAMQTAEGASPKLGWAGGEAADHNASNATWYYRWWHEKPATAAGTLSEFVPLIKFPNNLQNKLNIVANFSDVDTLLYLNEPERASQSDVTVQDALVQWYDVQAALPNHKLVSPGTSDDAAGIAWLTSFMDEVDLRNANADPLDDMRVDSVAFHWYGASSPNAVSAANSFLSRVDWYHTRFNRPIWITEFAMHDWEGNDLTEDMIQANADFLEIVLPELESRSFVEKYSYYNWFDDARAFVEDGDDRMPTVIGDVYVGTLQAGETRDLQGTSLGNDVVYMRGANLVNTGAAIPEALRGVDALESVNTISADTDWAFTDVTSTFVKVRSASTLRKTGLAQIGVSGDIANQGTLHVVEGTLRIEDGNFSGGGEIVVDAGATLEVSAQDGRGTTVLGDNNLTVEGAVSGPLRVQDGSMLIPMGTTATFDDDVIVRNAVLQVGGATFAKGAPTVFAVSTGLNLEYDASKDLSGDGQWDDTAGTNDPVLFSAPAATTSVNDPVWHGITASYDISSTGHAEGLNGYFELPGPQRSQQSATFEVVFKVDDASAGNDQVLFEAGGTGKGIAFVLNDDTLTFNVDGDSGDLNLNHTLTTGWHQAIGVIDLDAGGDTVTLFVNGQEVGTLSGQNINDWAGGNLAGLGGGANVATGVTSGAGNPFHGEVAIARYYVNKAFDQTEVQQNYLALTTPLEQIASSFLVQGDLRLEQGGLVQLNIGDEGTADKFTVDSTLNLVDAGLEVISLATASLEAGDSFDLFDANNVNGQFNSVTLPTLDTGLSWNTSDLHANGTIAVVIEGDFNADGMVDAADFTIWRDNSGLSVVPFSSGDSNGDGLVDAVDYAAWSSNYGNSSSQSSAAAVPEPTTLVMLLSLVGIASSRRAIK